MIKGYCIEADRVIFKSGNSIEKVSAILTDCFLIVADEMGEAPNFYNIATIEKLIHVREVSQQTTRGKIFV